MDVVVTIAEYRHRLQTLGYAEPTQVLYWRGLEQFKRFLADKEITDLRTVSRAVIDEYQACIQAEQNAEETKAIKLRSVKRLFEHLHETNRLLLNPTEGIVEVTRKNRKTGVVLTIAEIKKLLEQPNMSLKTGIRDRAMLEAMYSSGMRVNEVVSLEVYHADLKDEVIYIRKAKGGRQRVVPLGTTAAAYLKEYLEKIRPYYAKKNPKERTLFLNQFGLPMTRENIQAGLNRYKKQAGILKPVSPHTLRRSCATHMIQQGADIRYVQKLLGHAHLKTTQGYVQVLRKEIKDTHRQYHPGVENENENQEKNP